MKKTIIYSIVFLAIILTGLGSSFLISKKSAEKVRGSYAGEVSRLKGRMILFKGDDFRPCWLFTGEYVNLMTGSTFDVYVSFLGNIQAEP
jgi:hypothetical protein